MTMTDVEVYGTDWCEQTCQVREGLDRRGIPYRYVNVGRDRDAEAWLRQRGGGRLRTPTLRVGPRLIPEPTEADLRGVG
jgi:glutaredoxin